MTGTADHDRLKPKPFLITRTPSGEFQLIVRDTRFNGQNYPVVTSTPVEPLFATAAAARTFAKANLGAVAGEFATR